MLVFFCKRAEKLCNYFLSDTGVAYANELLAATGFDGVFFGNSGAEKFVQLTNVPGVLRDVNDPQSLIQRIHVSDVPALKEQGVIAGGMIPKIECCLMARNGGVPRTHIIDGRVPHSLLIEMFSDRGIGTMVY